MPHRVYKVTLADDTRGALLQLVGRSSKYPVGTVTQLLEHFATLAADGVRHEDRWTRAWVRQATGLPEDPPLPPREFHDGGPDEEFDPLGDLLP